MNKNKKLDFLRKLNKKLFKEIEITNSIPNIKCSSNWELYSTLKHLTDYKLTEKEIEQTLIIFKECKLMMEVRSNGFCPTYSILLPNMAWPGQQEKYEVLITIDDKQLPDGWSFYDLKKHFFSERNLKLLEFFEIQIPKQDRSYYEY